MGLEKDREVIKELQETISKLQKVVVNVANMAHSNQEKIKEIEEDHIKLRNSFTLYSTVGICKND